MPEFTEQEPLAQAFFRLRFEAPNEIVPPGVAAARRTVARRRTLRVTAASVLATAVLVGVGYLGTAIAGDRRPTASGSPSAGPSGRTLSPDELQQLGVTALRTFGVEPGRTRPGTLFGPVGGSGFSYGLGTAEQPFPAGDYELRAACVGAGSVAVSWSAPGSTGTVTARCGAGPVQASFRMAGPGSIDVRLAGDDSARGRAGIAVIVTDPLVVTAVNALPPSLYVLTSGSDLATSIRQDALGNSSRTGLHVLGLACAGQGNLTVTFSVGAAAASKTVVCADPPGLTSLQVQASAAGLPLTVRIEPDSAALGAAGFAYQVSAK